MTIANAAKAAINISGFQAYSDGSGAPCTVECAGYIYACDWLGGYRATLVRPVSGSRRENEIAARRVQGAYTAYIMANTSAEWRAQNTALYSD